MYDSPAQESNLDLDALYVSETLTYNTPSWELEHFPISHLPKANYNENPNKLNLSDPTQSNKPTTTNEQQCMCSLYTYQPEDNVRIYHKINLPNPG